jgi:antirestriction protein ArdC
MTKTTNKHRKGLSHEERAAKVVALNAQLAQAVETLTTSDGWMRMLAASAKLHRYSANNVLMLAIQAYERGTEITRVAGFRRWLELGRCVTKGEKGYVVIAPVRRRLSREEAAQAAARGECAYDSESQPALVIRGFKSERLFDIAQTSVVDPEKWIDEPAMPQLTGSAPAGLWDKLAALIGAEGFTLDRHDATPEDGSAHGWTRYSDHTMWIRPNVDEAEACRIALHEVAHVRCDHGARQVSRTQRETEADSVAWIVGQVVGVDFTEATAIYLGGWAGSGDKQKDVLTAAAEAVHRAANYMIGVLAPEQA